MLAGFWGKRAQRIKVSAAATALHQCVQSLHMKMTVYKTSAGAKFRSKATAGRRGTEGGGTGLVWGRQGVVHEMEVCAMWWANLWVHGNVDTNKWGNLSIYFPPFTLRMSIPNCELLTCDVTSSWGEMKLCLFQVPKLATLTVDRLEFWGRDSRRCKLAFDVLMLQYICFPHFSLSQHFRCLNKSQGCALLYIQCFKTIYGTRLGQQQRSTIRKHIRHDLTVHFFHKILNFCSSSELCRHRL